MWSVFVDKKFWRTTRDHSATLSPEKERGILHIIQKDLVTTRKHSPKKWQSQRDFNKKILV